MMFVSLFILSFLCVGATQMASVAIDELEPWANPKGRKGQDVQKATTMLFNHWLFRNRHMQQIFDGFPYFYKNPHTGAQAFFCFCEKVGSTAWKALLIKALNPAYFSSTLTKPNHSSHGSVPDLPTYSPAFVQNKLNDTTIPRFMLVRNPYSRVLSGWNGNTQQLYYGKFNRSLGFERFVYHLRDNRFALTKEVNDHFYPLVNKCMQPTSMTYDYYLKVEQMDDWYAPLIRKLKLEPEVSTGWENIQYYGDKNQPCFYKPAGQTCDTALTHVSAPQNCTEPVKPHVPPHHITSSFSSHSAHSKITRSSDQLSDFFTAPKMIEAINLFAAQDFDRYGYVRERNGTLAGYLERLKSPNCTMG